LDDRLAGIGDVATAPNIGQILGRSCEVGGQSSHDGPDTLCDMSEPYLLSSVMPTTPPRRPPWGGPRARRPRRTAPRDRRRGAAAPTVTANGGRAQWPVPSGVLVNGTTYYWLARLQWTCHVSPQWMSEGVDESA
jgi:hypothetical protein